MSRNIQVSQTQYDYDKTAIIPTTNLASVPGHDSTFTSAVTHRGNPTHAMRWNNMGNTFVTTTYNYDDLGNLRSIVDPNGNATTCALCMVAGTSSGCPSAACGEIPSRAACSLMALRVVSGASSSRLNCGSSLITPVFSFDPRSAVAENWPLVRPYAIIFYENKRNTKHGLNGHKASRPV
jgi:YD repeat-containing protein